MLNENSNYQCVGVITGEYEDVDGRGVVCDADPRSGRLVLLVVVGDDGGERAAQDLEAVGEHLVVQPLLEVALRQLANEEHAHGHPAELQEKERDPKRTS